MIAVLNDWGAAWGTWFQAWVVQDTVFLVLVLGVLGLLRRSPPRVRAAVATLGVVKLAVPPFIPARWFAGGAGETAVEPTAPLLFPFGTGSESGTGVVGDLTGGLTPATAVMLLWASVAVTRLILSLLQSVPLYVELRRASPVPREEIPAELRDAGLDVRRGERIAVPLTMGLFNRRILVPPAWSRWTPEVRATVLEHERAHIRRHDNFVQPLEVLVQAVFFFHPLVHLLIGRLRIWREMACDDLSVGIDPRQRLAYSRFLLEMAETVLEPRPMAESASTLMRRRCELMIRVSHQVKESAMSPVSKIRLAVLAAVLLLAAVPLSMVHGDTPPPPPPPKRVAKAEPVPPVAPQPAEKIVRKDAPAPADAPPPPPPSVEVRLAADGLYVGGEKVEKGQFDDAVKKAVQEKGGKVVIRIDNDGGVTMGKVHAMQAQLKDLGLYEVIYTGELGEAVPMVLPPDKAREKLEKLPKEMVLPVEVDAAGVVTVGGKKTAGVDVTKVVMKRMQAEPKTVVTLHTEKDTTYGAFVQVLESLKKGGADKIMIADPR